MTTLDKIFEDLVIGIIRATEAGILQNDPHAAGTSAAKLDLKAKKNLKILLLDMIGEDELPPIGEMGKQVAAATFELKTNTKAHKYHLQRVMNRNDFRKELRQKVNDLLP